MREFSKTLSRLNGDAQDQINELLAQLRLVQEETEDMLRELSQTIERIGEKLDEIAMDG